jgi:hypothetical protein
MDKFLERYNRLGELTRKRQTKRPITRDWIGNLKTKQKNWQEGEAKAQMASDFYQA